MAAPTEAEIRTALAARTSKWPADNPAVALVEAVKGYATMLTGPAYESLETPDPRDELIGHVDEADVWTDLRPSEAIVLRDLARGAIERAAAAAERAIVDEIVAAGLRFAEQHPGAPRAKTLQPV